MISRALNQWYTRQVKHLSNEENCRIFYVIRKIYSKESIYCGSFVKIFQIVKVSSTNGSEGTEKVKNKSSELIMKAPYLKIAVIW